MHGENHAGGPCLLGVRPPRHRRSTPPYRWRAPPALCRPWSLLTGPCRSLASTALRSSATARSRPWTSKPCNDSRRRRRLHQHRSHGRKACMNTRDYRRGLLSFVADRWWVVLLRGICAVVFGILAFVWPGLTLLSLVLLYGAYALVDGILSIACGVAGNAAPRSWWMMIIV